MAAKWSEAELPLFDPPSRAINDPERALAALAAECQTCERCTLYRNATQAVFGEGPPRAAMMLVGEQPGDQEDLAGKPFVGPAGKVLDRGLEEAGVDRRAVYVTNAVKHFKNEPRGKRRIHKKPDTSEIDACRWWLDKEIEIVQPQLIVAMGASAARGVLRRAAAIGANRGKLIPMDDHRHALITVHPSYLLRLREREDKLREFKLFVADLKLAAKSLSN